MPLSEHEQRILDEIEQRLAAEDPKFARSTSAATPRGLAVRRIKRSVVGFILGFVLLIAGLVSDLVVALGIAGFVVMLASVLVIAKSSKDLGGPLSQRSRQPGSGWFGRAEERWRKRFDRGNGGN
jgi:uncharacterized membrane protein